MKETQFFGWAGNVLQVDLAKEKFVIEPLDREFALNYIGGRGFSSRLQFDLINPRIDPLSPENVLMFTVGPLTGTLAPGSGRWRVAAKSPQTGIIGDGDGCGFFGAQLKWAGFDIVIIRGRAKNPSYLWIDDGESVLADGTHLWGASTRETERLIREDVGDPDVEVATTGPAAINMVKFCIVLNGMRSAGRGGMGTVMASKNLKAVAVRGTKGVKIAKPEEFLKIIEKAQSDIKRQLASQNLTPNTYFRGGVPDASDQRSPWGILGTRNSQTGVFEDFEKITTKVLKDQYYVKRKGHLCPRSCDHLMVVEEGPTFGYSIQFGQTGNFGSYIGNSDIKSVIEVHVLADMLGIDALSLGPTLGLAMECYEKGIITKEDTDGLELKWGNMEAVKELLPKIAKREGFGNILAEGTRGAARIIGKGAERYAMHVKGLEPPWIDDPRGALGWGLAFAVSSRGGSHRRGAPGFIDRLNPIGQGKRVFDKENMNSVIESLNLCAFFRYTNQAEFLAKMYSTATGVKIDGIGLIKIGERITNIERAFNVREGITRADDTLPKRFLEEPLPEGKSKGHVVHLDEMLDEYYSERNWDIKTGIPKRSKLLELGLNDVADELERLKKLPQE